MYKLFKNVRVLWILLVAPRQHEFPTGVLGMSPEHPPDVSRTFLGSLRCLEDLHETDRGTVGNNLRHSKCWLMNSEKNNVPRIETPGRFTAITSEARSDAGNEDFGVSFFKKKVV